METTGAFPDVDYAALWVRQGYLHRSPGNGYELVKSLPEGRTARMIAPDHELAEWAYSAGQFGWMARDTPPQGILSRKGSAGVFLLFAQERQLILALNVITDEPEIEGLQLALSELSSELKAHYEGGTPLPVTEPVQVDTGFLDAMAMGDESFVRHMLDLCIDQLAIGSEALFDALSQNVPKDVMHHAHKLRSTARTAGAESLDTLLATIEGQAGEGDLTGVRQAIRACEQTISAINLVLAGR